MIYERCRICHQLVDPVESETDICRHCEMTRHILDDRGRAQ
jgi:RNA polymerase subunit RPABC4/transcription elongation factor Spt4